MTNLDKIKKWAIDNDYRYEIVFRKTVVVLRKKEWCQTDEVDKTMYIHLEYKTYKLLGIERYIVHSCTTHEPKELENLFIPLNNVKRDEKLLREYLKDE